MKVAAVQHDVVWADKDANFARLGPMIAAAAGAGARLVVLTEMYSTGFVMDGERVAEPVDGPSTRFLVDEAQRHGVWVCGSLPELAEGQDRPYNRLVLSAPDGTCHRYAKIHPFTYAGEEEHYAAGTDRVVVDVEGVRVGLFVCYDLRFADEFWALAPGVDAYVVPANWPESRREHWRALLTARAIENQAYVIGVNRVGEGDRLTYVGDSRIVDPLGHVVAEASGTEALLVADVDPEVVAATRARFPFLQDRRSP
jgi:predicted amidohydrolase